MSSGLQDWALHPNLKCLNRKKNGGKHPFPFGLTSLQELHWPQPINQQQKLVINGQCREYTTRVVIVIVGSCTLFGQGQ
jgi:hypothetical protein